MPSKRNSVLEGFRDRKLADIQEETRDIIDSREDKPEVDEWDLKKSQERIQKKSEKTDRT